ncbi:MAG: 4Fe-4S binding protein [Oscillospiraceae bacterium]
MAKKPQFSYDRCIACGICVQSCPVSALELCKTDIDEYGKAYPELANDKCIGCDMCKKACPMDAIEMGEQTL